MLQEKHKDPLQKKKKICVVRAVSGRVDSSLYTRFHFSFSVVRVSVTLSSRFFVFSLSKNMYSWHFFFLARWRCPSVPVVRISVYRTLRACVTQVSIRKSFSRVWNQHFCPWQCCRCSLLFFFLILLGAQNNIKAVCLCKRNLFL